MEARERKVGPHMGKTTPYPLAMCMSDLWPLSGVQVKKAVPFGIKGLEFESRSLTSLEFWFLYPEKK